MVQKGAGVRQLICFGQDQPEVADERKPLECPAAAGHTGWRSEAETDLVRPEFPDQVVKQPLLILVRWIAPRSVNQDHRTAGQLAYDPSRVSRRLDAGNRQLEQIAQKADLIMGSSPADIGRHQSDRACLAGGRALLISCQSGLEMGGQLQGCCRLAGSCRTGKQYPCLTVPLDRYFAMRPDPSRNGPADRIQRSFMVTVLYPDRLVDDLGSHIQRDIVRHETILQQSEGGRPIHHDTVFSRLCRPRI